MPRSCWGTYGRVAVIETDGVSMPKQIHPNHRSVKKIVRTWEAQFMGKTNRCAFNRALDAAHALVNKLNQQSN